MRRPDASLRFRYPGRTSWKPAEPGRTTRGWCHRARPPSGWRADRGATTPIHRPSRARTDPRLEPWPRIDHVHVEHRPRSADADLDGVGGTETRVSDAVGDDLTHEQRGVVHDRVVQRHPERLEGTAGLGGRSRIGGQPKSHVEEHVRMPTQDRSYCKRGMRTPTAQVSQWAGAARDRVAEEGSVVVAGPAAAGEPAAAGRVVPVRAAAAAAARAPARGGRLGSDRSCRSWGPPSLSSCRISVPFAVSVGCVSGFWLSLRQRRRSRRRSSCAFDIFERPSIPRSLASSYSCR